MIIPVEKRKTWRNANLRLYNHFYDLESEVKNDFSDYSVL